MTAPSPSTNTNGDIRVTVYSEGTALADTVRIVSVKVTSAVNRIPSATIIIVDEDSTSDTVCFAVSDGETLIPGKAVRIDVAYGTGTAVTIFDGIVVKQSLRGGAYTEGRLEVECRDKAIAMTVGRKCANYVDLSDSDIISKVVGNYTGLSVDVTATTVTNKELVQFDVSDWDFMLTRAEANGFVVIASAGKLTVKAPATDVAAVLSLTYGEDIIDFEAEVDARSQLSSVDSVAWDPATQAIVSQSVTPKTLNAQGNLTASTLAQVLNLSSYRLQSSVPLDSDTLKAWADGRQMRAALARMRGRVSFQGSGLATPGVIASLSGVGKRYDGDAYLSEVTHKVIDGRWETDATFGLSEQSFAERHSLASPLASGLTAAVSGLQIGVVLKLDADPSQEYKIQVSLPVMQADVAGVWARLASYYGSDGIGCFFIPEIGDEVIVGFLNNDPSYPLILGSLYSSKRKPAYELTADNFTKAIVTRSKMKITFDEDKKIITVLTPGNNTIVLSDDGKSILLQDQNSNKVTLNESGITLDSPKDITLTAKGKITLDAVGEIGITSKADLKQTALNIKNTANVGFVATGSASAELSASGQTTVKGALVMIN